MSEGDFIAIEARYHMTCLNRSANWIGYKQMFPTPTKKSLLLQLAELVSYVEDKIADSEVIPVFKLRHFVEFFKKRLEQLTGESKGCNMLITVKEGMGDAVHKSCELDAEIDIMNVARIVKQIRYMIYER
ncbi:hypothetical protein Hamer_G008772, partial [Homarus americanus]